LLDRRYPGWSMHIDLDNLKLDAPSFWVGRCGCVLAQLGWAVPGGWFVVPYIDHEVRVGSYARMADLLFPLPTTNAAIEHGFSVEPFDGGMSVGEFENRWDILTAEWKAAIAARRV
jgi:hypothetical protein